MHQNSRLPKGKRGFHVRHTVCTNDLGIVNLLRKSRQRSRNPSSQTPAKGQACEQASQRTAVSGLLCSLCSAQLPKKVAFDVGKSGTIQRTKPSQVDPQLPLQPLLNLFLGPSHYTPRSEQERLCCTRPTPATVSQNPVIRPCHPLTLSLQPWESIFPHHKNHIWTAFLGTRLSSRLVVGSLRQVPEAGWFLSVSSSHHPTPCSDKQRALHSTGAP